MFPHEEFLKKALEECRITALVQDLGFLYVQLVAGSNASQEDFQTALAVNKILKKAAEEIADLGPKPVIPHPMDQEVK